MHIITHIPLCVAESKDEVSHLKELLGICREYINAVRIKEALSDSSIDNARFTELGAYFTHCNMEIAHLMLALDLAMSNSFRKKNYITAAAFARRLLELPDVSLEKNAKLRGKAQKVAKKSEQEGRNADTLNYDERKPFVLCAKSLTPIYRETKHVKCAYCASSFLPEYDGSLCPTCNLATVGVETLGLVTMALNRNSSGNGGKFRN